MLTDMLAYYQKVSQGYISFYLLRYSHFFIVGKQAKIIISVAWTIKTCVLSRLLLKQCSVESASLSFQQQPSSLQVVSLTSPHDCLTCAGIWEQFKSE